MTEAAFIANGSQWPSSDNQILCKGSFSGNANLSRYNLAAVESVTVNVGEFLFNNGASLNFVEALTCGTDYIFRAFAHTTNTLQRSDFTHHLKCSTLVCGHGETCTLTQGCWKTHGPEGCIKGNNTNGWPAISLLLGDVTYTDSDIELCIILNTPAQGNGLVALAHQLITAKLNIEKGAYTVSAADIASADDLLGV